MQWRDAFSVGIPEIDAQHKILVQCINDLQAAVAGNERWSLVHATLVRLGDYTRIHFTVEESLMRILGCASEAHIEEHRRFSYRLDELKARALSDDVSNEAPEFLGSWLSGHIRGCDKDYAAHFVRWQQTRARPTTRRVARRVKAKRAPAARV